MHSVRWPGRGAIAAALGATLLVAGCRTPPLATGPQGWEDPARAAWYNAGQGSRLIPLSWFQALEPPTDGQVAAGSHFSDAAYLARFRVLPPWPGAKLPIGFGVSSIDDSRLVKTNLHWISGRAPKDDRVDWVGLNCAACHTAQMSYAGKPIMVDGAPGLFDFQSFVESLDKALIETQASAASGADGQRWNRFATAVLGHDNDTAENRKQLLAALTRLVDWEGQAEALNHTDLRYGFGRVDAVGHIFNRTLLFAGAPQPTPNAPDAPVSYPHLWNITKQTQLQWDGVAQNDKLNIGAIPTDYGAMGRNVGEVLGVFGEAVIKAPSGPTDLSGFVSSADITNLNALEVLLTRLQPPRWPSAAFGTPGHIDVADASGRKLTPDEVMKSGETLFNANCSSCHTPHEHYETMKTFAEMGPQNQTDEWMACNTWAYTGASGALTGVPANYSVGDKLGATEPVRVLLTTTVKGALVGQKLAFTEAALGNIFGVTPLPRAARPLGAFPVPQTAKDLRLRFCQQNASDPLLAYKARPLEGIWATAPYLHNGSVPTLYDLLQAPANRPATFRMGARAFDPKKVGYDTSPAAEGNSFVFNTALPGNSNKGHVYGVGAMTEAQRLELLEYLKSL